jgi:hypothetical protein
MGDVALCEWQCDGRPPFDGRPSPQWGDRGDLNPRPPGPQPGALTELSYDHHENIHHTTGGGYDPNPHHRVSRDRTRHVRFGLVMPP